MDRTIWNGVSPQIKTLLQKYLDNAYTGGDGNRVILVDADGEVLTSLGGGGGAGGGSIVYSNAAGDFTATPNNGAKTITITGLPFTLSALHVVGGSMTKLSVTTGLKTPLYPDSIVVAGGVITLTGVDDFVTGDVVYMTLIGPDKWYDLDKDVAKFELENPDYSHYNDPEHLDDDNLGATGMTGTYERDIIPGSSYNHMSATFLLTADDTGNTVTMKIYASNDPDITLPAATVAIVASDGIPDISTMVLGTGSISVNGGSTGGYFVIDEDTQFENYVIERLYVTATAGTVGNAADIFIKKYY